MRRKRRLEQRGFTLLESLFVVALFPMLFLSLYSVMDMARVIFNTNSVYSQLNQSAMQTLRSVSRELGQTSPLLIPSHLTLTANGANNTVTFQIPVDWDNDGDSVTSDLNPAIEWGAYDQVGQLQDGRLGGWIRYSVVNNQLLRDVLDATLTPIQGLQRVEANNVQTFTATRDQNSIALTITLLGTDNIGQNGAARTIQTSFQTNTILRNAVS